jgi:S1-C subfamily serine protease
VVSAVSRGSLSSRYRFRPGDIFLEVMGEEISDTDQLQDVLDESDGLRSWNLTLDRGGRVTKSRIRF